MGMGICRLEPRSDENSMTFNSPLPAVKEYIPFSLNICALNFYSGFTLVKGFL